MTNVILSKRQLVEQVNKLADEYLGGSLGIAAFGRLMENNVKDLIPMDWELIRYRCDDESWTCEILVGSMRTHEVFCSWPTYIKDRFRR